MLDSIGESFKIANQPLNLDRTGYTLYLYPLSIHLPYDSEIKIWEVHGWIDENVGDHDTADRWYIESYIYGPPRAGVIGFFMSFRYETDALLTKMRWS